MQKGLVFLSEIQAVWNSKDYTHSCLAVEPVEAKDALNCICIIVMYAKQTKKNDSKVFNKASL